MFKNKHLEPYLYHFCNLKQAIFSVKRKKHSNKKIIPKKKWFILKKIVTLHIQNLKNNFMAKKQVNTKVNEVENIEAALTKTEMFIEKNRKEMMIGLGVLIAIVLAIIAFNNFYRIPAEKEAQDKMVVCVDYFERDSFNLALYGDGINDGLEAIIDDYSITDAAELASVYAGICCYNLGEYEKAVKYLNKFNAKSVNITPAVIGLARRPHRAGNPRCAVDYRQSRPARSRCRYGRSLVRATGHSWSTSRSHRLRINWSFRLTEREA